MTKNVTATLAILCFVITLTALSGFAKSGDVEEPFPRKNPFVPDEILVQLKSGYSVESVLSDPIAQIAPQEIGTKAPHGLVRLKIRSGESVVSAVTALKAKEGVLFAQPNYIYQAALVPDDPSYSSQWALPKIGAPAAWDVTTGSPDVLVAVLDTGIDLNHPDLAGNLWINPGETPGNGIDDDANGYVDDIHGWNSYSNSSDVQDTFGHGTHVSGIIGAVGSNGIGVSGVNWTTRIVAAKASSGDLFTTIDLAQGIDYVTALREKKGANVVAINASLGGPVSEDPLLNQAIERAGKAGILFVAAAGNSNTDNDDQEKTPFYPASLFKPYVLSVAATDGNDSLAVFEDSKASNYGRRTVHLGAPGKNILSTYTTPGYSTLSGTSMAAPHVTGVIALLKSQHPGWDWIALKNKVLSSGTPVSSLAKTTITGRRLLAAGDGGLGALTGSGQTVQSRLRPIGDTLDLSPGTFLDLAALNIRDESSLGSLDVPLTRNGAAYGTLTLKDDGSAPDQVAGDGIASARWTVPAQADSTYRFSFPDGTLTVTVQLAPEPPPAPSGGGGGGGGGCSVTGPGPFFLLFLPAVLFALKRKKPVLPER